MKPSQTEMRREYQKWYTLFWEQSGGALADCR